MESVADVAYTATNFGMWDQVADIIKCANFYLNR